MSKVRMLSNYTAGGGTLLEQGKAYLRDQASAEFLVSRGVAKLIEDEGGNAVYPVAGPTLVSDQAVSIFEIPLPPGAMAGGSLEYVIRASDGEDHQVLTGIVRFAAVNKGGSYTVDVNHEVFGIACSDGELSAGWALSEGADRVILTLTPATTLETLSLFEIFYTITSSTPERLTIL